jgi:nicotinate phosphoribosyltransferase
VIDFGLRRAHGAEAGLLAARASYIAGFAGTATVLAGMQYGIPIYGTMAHSFVQAHPDEAAAFEHFAQAQPDNAVLLIDTYDTETAARKVVALAPLLKANGIPVKGVRLDSGDLADHARKVRHILDGGGLRDAQILASGNLDEYGLRTLVHPEQRTDRQFRRRHRHDHLIGCTFIGLRLQTPRIRWSSLSQAIGGQGHLARA